MGISIILIALGAIFIWGTDASVSGADLSTIGVILLAVGAVGGLLSLVYWSSWGGGAMRRPPHERRIVER
jgi:hypothetical protein